MSKLDLNALKNKLHSLQANTNRSAYLWKPEAGKTDIRIVPYQFCLENPFIEMYFHYAIGKKSYVSLETFGKDDPIYEFSEKLQNTGDKEDWKMGKKIEPKLRTFVPIIVRGKEKEGVKFWGFGKEIYTELLSITTDPEWGDITDLEKGRDVTVEFVSAKDAGNTYGKISIRVKPNVSAATTDTTVLQLINEKQANIFDVFASQTKTYDELENILKRWLKPDEEAEEVDNANEEAETEEVETEAEEITPPVVEKKVEEKPVAKPTAKPTAKKVEPVKTSNVKQAFNELFNEE